MDETTWIELFHAHMPPLYRAVSRRVGARRALAEDVTQEAWLRALRAWRRDGVPRDPDAWLLTVASNLLRNHFRRPEHRTDVELDGRAACGDAESAEGEAAAARSAEIQRALARLRPDQAELLAERHLDGQPLARIASRRGVSERAVEGRLRRARAALARHVDPDILDRTASTH
ncbi:MAG: sigma-70 family RNA polymerase sigma factor [Planctomycetota bacterium]